MGPTLTAGRRYLIAIVATTSRAEVAARCRVDPSLVSRWSSGERRPTEAQRAQLSAAYGISAAAWGAAWIDGAVADVRV